jgi:hypothetical protein
MTTTAQVLNTIGLLFGLVGVGLIFVWGPPQPQLDEGVGIGQEDGTPLDNGLTVAQHNATVRRRRIRHKVLSRVGLGLVFLGFLSQLFAVWA